eukprot:scaffold12.g8098.t1
MRRRQRARAGRPPAVPAAAWAAVAGHLTPEDRLSLSTVSKAAHAGCLVHARGIRLDLDAPAACHARRLPFFAARRIHTILVTSGGASEPSAAAGADAEQHEMWRSLDPSLRPGRLQWPLARLCDRLGLTARSNPPPQLVALRISLPSMACATTDLQAALARAGVMRLFSEVAISRGLCHLDGALTEALVRANTTASLLLPALQTPCPYRVLWDLAVQVSSSEELASLLEAATPAALPALRSLALVAEPGEDVAAIRADFGLLEHPGITQVTLNSIELAGGFGDLQHLTGLQSLSAWYEEDQGPPLNLGGEIAALSALRQLSSLAVHNLASSEGLNRLRHLTSLSVMPHPGSALTLEGLPALQQLSLDLSACGSTGHEPLRRGAAAHAPPGAGLDSLRQVELRCFVWGRPPPEAGTAAAGAAAEAEGAAQQQQGGGGEEGGEEADAGSDSEDEEGEAEAEADGADEGGDGEEEEEQEEEEEEEAWEEGEVEGWAPGSGEEQPADALARLERAYLSRLLARLPTLTAIALTDYLGVVGVPASKGASGTGAARAAAAGSGGDAGWRDTTECSIAGAVWRRAPSRAACRPQIRSGRRLVVTAARAPPPREPAPAPPPGSLSVSAWAQSASEAAARAYSSLGAKLGAAHDRHGKSARTAVQALLGGRDMWVSREVLEHHEYMARRRRSIEESRRALEEDRRAAAEHQVLQALLDQLLRENGEEMQCRLVTRRDEAAPSPKPAASQPPQPRAPVPAPRPSLLVWPPAAADAAPAAASSRMAAAEASAAAAAAWARTTAAREAAAEAATAGTDRQPAVQHTGDAEAWEWAAAAWHAAHAALEAARQACPDAPAVRESEAAVEAARALKAQRRAWRDS